MRETARAVVLLAVGALALTATAPAGAAGGGVATLVNGRSGRHLSYALLQAKADVGRVPATLHEPDGSTQREPHEGVSAKQLVRLAGIDPGHVEQIEIDRPNTTGSVILSRDEIDPGFAGDPLPGLQQATFDATANENQVRFFRPLRPDADGRPDVNALDELDSPRGADLVVHVTTRGRLLDVSATPVPAQTSVATPVQFTASVTPPVGGATYEWDFGDGQTATGGAAIEHAYATDGSYQAVVTALTDDGSGAALADVLVGAPSGGGGALGIGPSAPALSAGGGGAAGGGGGATRAGGGSGHRDAAAFGSARAADPVAARTTATTAPGATRASRIGAPGTGASPTGGPRARSGSRSRRRGAHTTTSGSARQPQTTSPTAQAPTARVAGVVLAADGVPVNATPSLVPQQDRGARRESAAAAARASASSSQPLSWWLLAGLGLGLLVGFGAVRESGLQPFPRRLGAS